MRKWYLSDGFVIFLWFLLLGNAMFFILNCIGAAFVLTEITWRSWFSIAINGVGTVGCIYSLRMTYRERIEGDN